MRRQAGISLSMLAKKCDAAFGTTIFGKLIKEEVREERATRDNAAEPTAEVGANEIDQTFEEFYRTEKNALLAFVRANGVAPDGAAVIVQDVMLECFQRWSTIGNRLAWIRGVAKKKMLEHWRREGWRRGELGVGDPQLAVELAKLASPSAEAEVMSDASLVALCKQLPHRQKAVMVKVLTGMVPAEIAGELQISEAGVRSHMRMARQTLRVAFEREAVQSSLEAGDLVGEGQACENLAAALLRVQRGAEARAIWQRASDVYRQAGLYMNAGKALLDLGAALNDDGKYEDARRIFRNALQLFVDARPRLQGFAFLTQHRSEPCAANVRPHVRKLSVRCSTQSTGTASALMPPSRRQLRSRSTAKHYRRRPAPRPAIPTGARRLFSRGPAIRIVQHISRDCSSNPVSRETPVQA
jgi:DNA-directed RNA polymerase specialized sigma24 family protein